MVFDADTHISLTEPNGWDVNMLLREMDRARIDRALVWLQPPYMRDIKDANQYVYESAKTNPDRLVPFGWTDPHFGQEQALGMIERCVSDYKMKGVKLNGAQNNFLIDDPVMSLPLVDAIAELGVILALHVGADAIEQTHPFRVAKIAKRHPRMPILMIHMGGAAIPDFSAACIEIARDHSNIHLIGSSVSYLSILQAIHTLGAERVCFGSDAPFRIPRVERAAYDALLDGEVTEEEKELVMGGNISRLLA